MPLTIPLIRGAGGAFCVAAVSLALPPKTARVRVGLGVRLGVGVELVKCHRLLQTCEIIAMIVPAARITKTNQPEQQQKNNTTKKTSASALAERECLTSRYPHLCHIGGLLYFSFHIVLEFV